VLILNALMDTKLWYSLELVVLNVSQDLFAMESIAQLAQQELNQ
jgi:hypothetical protein